MHTFTQIKWDNLLATRSATATKEKSYFLDEYAKRNPSSSWVNNGVSDLLKLSHSEILGSVLSCVDHDVKIVDDGHQALPGHSGGKNPN